MVPPNQVRSSAGPSSNLIALDNLFITCSISLAEEKPKRGNGNGKGSSSSKGYVSLKYLDFPQAVWALLKSGNRGGFILHLLKSEMVSHI